MSGAQRTGPQVINPAKSPPLFVPIGLILAGLVGLLLFLILLFYKAPMAFGEFRFNQATLAVVHLFTLGFATAVMTGAFYQIIPVMLIAQPVNGRWAALQGVLYLTGSAVLITSFYVHDTRWLAIGGTLVVVAVLLFIALVGRSMATATQWTISGSYMIAGLSFLAATVLWGLVLALNLRYNFLGDTLNHGPVGAHMVLGLGGWFMLTIFGVTYQLIPMFALSNRGGEDVGKQPLVWLSIGLWGAFLALVVSLPAWITGAMLVVALAGVIAYAREMAGIIRQRRRTELDLGMRYALTAFGFLLLSLPLLAVGALTRLSPILVAATWLFLSGFVGSMILGMLYKIVPFLFWHYLLKTRTDKAQRLPNLVQMYHQGMAEGSYWFWVGGVLLTALLAGIGEPALARWPLLLCIVGSLLFMTTMIQVLRAKPLT